MTGSATLTIVVSSVCMSVASRIPTVIRTSAPPRSTTSLSWCAWRKLGGASERAGLATAISSPGWADTIVSFPAAPRADRSRLGHLHFSDRSDDEGGSSSGYGGGKIYEIVREPAGTADQAGRRTACMRIGFAASVAIRAVPEFLKRCA